MVKTVLGSSVNAVVVAEKTKSKFIKRNVRIVHSLVLAPNEVSEFIDTFSLCIETIISSAI